ncbi:MAG: hypothetical protein QW503_02340 [Sulfolobales archaeon]
MAEHEIEALTEKYYNTVRECFERDGVWDVVIRKFPPMALRSAVRQIVERFVKRGEDPDLFNFCMYFEGITDFDSIASFIDHLKKKGYIPPTPEEEVEQLLAWLEQDANRLGYRLVKEEEWAKISGRYEALYREIQKLKAEKKVLESKIKELESVLEEYKKKGKINIEDLKQRITPETKPPPPPPPPKPRKISEVLPWEDFLRRIRDFLVHEGIPAPLVNRITTEEEKYLREVYETRDVTELNTVFYRLLEYIANEYIPVRFIVVPAIMLADQGVSVREPQPAWFWGRYGRPPISFVYPRFVEWATSIELSGYKVRYTLVPITHKTHFIHNPGVDPREILVAVDKEQNLISLSSNEALVYYFDAEARELVYHRYQPCKLMYK